MRVRGVNAMVTGASSGIGRATAVLLARKGASVWAVARSEGALKELASEHPSIRPVVADLTDEAARRDVMAQAGTLDVLVNNAGMGWMGLVEDMPFDEVRRLYELNVLALIDLSLQCLPRMLDARRGHIVNMSSAAAWVTFPPLSVYGSTKWAVQGFSEGLRRELNGRPVSVTTINPGPVTSRFGSRAHATQLPTDALVEGGWVGVPASWVARAVVRAVHLGAWPGYSTIAVPRIVGLSRIGGLPVTQWIVDLAVWPFTATRHQRSGDDHD